MFKLHITDFTHYDIPISIMDEYRDQVLAEIQAYVALQDVVQNILDEHIPEAVKRCLLKPLLPDAVHNILHEPVPESVKRGLLAADVLEADGEVPRPLAFSGTTT